MDPLSDVLSLLNTRSVLSATLLAGGAWALQFPPQPGLKFSAVIRGHCWLAIDGMAEPIRLQAGDCFLLRDSPPYRLASDLSLDAPGAHDIFVAATDGVARCGTAEDFLAIGGRFTFDETNAPLLLDALPHLIHVGADSDQAEVLRWVLTRLASELSAGGAGASLMTDHLSHIMLVQALRTHLMSHAHPPAGWLAALSDRKISTALGLLHAEPGRRWKLDELAKTVGMSRSTFALRFKQLVGASPLDYLLRWRMRLAGKALREGKQTVSAIALSHGYDTESAFSSAFKRVMGCAPKHYRAGRSSSPALATPA